MTVRLERGGSHTCDYHVIIVKIQVDDDDLELLEDVLNVFCEMSNAACMPDTSSNAQF